MSSFILKIIACSSMLIDHIGFELFPGVNILRIIGRLALPIFAFQLAIGFEHTKKQNKYIWYMLSFAIISQVPFMLFVNSFKLNVLFTFVLSMLCLYSIKNIKNVPLKILIIISILTLTYFYFNCDYGIYGIIMVIMFYLTKKHPILMTISYFIITLFYILAGHMATQLYSLIALPLILLYNGKKGKDVKWLFYIFYPSHMLILYLLNIIK